jgi:hypothetical protein
MDSLLRTRKVYRVAESFESTQSKFSRILLEHRLGKMEQNGSFSYQANILLSPYRFGGNYLRIVYGKGYLEVDKKNTLIHFIICPNLIYVFFVLLIFPILTGIAIFDNKYLIPGGKDNIRTIGESFLLIEGVLFAVILAGTWILQQAFQRRFNLQSSRS